MAPQEKTTPLGHGKKSAKMAEINDHNIGPLLHAGKKAQTASWVSWCPARP
jgi:hypothetical protein